MLGDVLYESSQLRVIEHTCPASGDIPEGSFEGPTLSFVRTGVGALEVGDEQLLVDPNQVVCLPAGIRFRVKHLCCRGSSCAVSLELPVPGTTGIRSPSPGWSPWRSGRRVLPRDIALGVSLHRLLANVQTREADGRAVDADARSELRAILHSIERADRSFDANGHPGIDDPARKDRIGKARVFLNAQLSEPVRLEQLAEAVGYSKYHFCRLFKEEAGLTPHEYLTRLRLNQALEELHELELEVSEIAVRLGFSSHSHFTSTFRQWTGMTPSAYRASLS